MPLPGPVTPSPRPSASGISSPAPYSTTRLSDTLVLERYVSPGVVEVPEAVLHSHTLILRKGSPTLLEWRISGRDRFLHLLPGSSSLLPAGLLEAAPDHARASRHGHHPSHRPNSLRARHRRYRKAWQDLRIQRERVPAMVPPRLRRLRRLVKHHMLPAAPASGSSSLLTPPALRHDRLNALFHVREPSHSSFT
jgi:hypothetical protein